MVTFKGGWDKLYYTQHTLLSNVRQLPILFFFEKQTHIQGREKEVLTQKHTTTSLKSHGNIGALLIVSTNGLMLLYARQICLGSRCVKTC